MTTINAFHPEYVKTHMPDFLSKVQVESTQYANGVINGGKSKAAREAKQGKTVNTVVPAHKHRPSTAVKEFHIYNKAGLPKGVKK